MTSRTRAHTPAHRLQSAVAMDTGCGGTSRRRVNAEVCASFKLSLYHRPDLFQHALSEHTQPERLHA